MLAGRYELRGLLGKGGMAEVHEAVVHGAQGFVRRVAVKRLLAEASDDAMVVRMFLDEARIASRLHHGGIVGVLDFGMADEGAFQVLEFVDGWDGDVLLRRAGALGESIPVDVALHVVTEVAHALAYAHEASENGVPLAIVHRDVKPSNILVSRSGDVKLADFGIALARERCARTTGFVARGTSEYMSPEQLFGGAVDPRTDVFALGCTLHALLTHASPSASEAARAKLLRGSELELTPSIPREVRDVIARAVRVSPDDRYPTARDMAHALGSVLASRLRGDPKTRLIEWLAHLADPSAVQVQTEIGAKRVVTGASVPSPGKSFGRYQIEALVATGGMGSVYRAKDSALGRPVALKVLRDSDAEDPESSGRFFREARIAAGLAHPNIVAIYDVGDVDGAPFLAMEWLGGTPVSQLPREAPLALRLAILLDVAHALAFAHAHGVVHRDVKPSNVIVDRTGRAKLLDFGIARQIEMPLSGPAFETSHGVIVGTPSYMAPEQMASSIVSPAADQFSWGVLAFQLLTGLHPRQIVLTFPFHDPRSLRWDRGPANVAGGAAVEPLRIPIPAAIIAVVERTLGLDPLHRFPSAHALVSALRAALVEAGFPPDPRTGGESRAPSPAPEAGGPTDEAVAHRAGSPAPAGRGPVGSLPSLPASSLHSGPLAAPLPIRAVPVAPTLSASARPADDRVQRRSPRRSRERSTTGLWIAIVALSTMLVGISTLAIVKLWPGRVATPSPSSAALPSSAASASTIPATVSASAVVNDAPTPPPPVPPAQREPRASRAPASPNLTDPFGAHPPKGAKPSHCKEVLANGRQTVLDLCPVATTPRCTCEGLSDGWVAPLCADPAPKRQCGPDRDTAPFSGAGKKTGDACSGFTMTGTENSERVSGTLNCIFCANPPPTMAVPNTICRGVDRQNTVREGRWLED